MLGGGAVVLGELLVVGESLGLPLEVTLGDDELGGLLNEVDGLWLVAGLVLTAGLALGLADGRDEGDLLALAAGLLAAGEAAGVLPGTPAGWET